MKTPTCEENLKDTWPTIDKLINKLSKTTSITSVVEDDIIIAKPDGITNSMNKQFCRIGEQLSSRIPNKPNIFVIEPC